MNPRATAKKLLPPERYEALSFTLRRARLLPRKRNAAKTMDRWFVGTYGPVVRKGPFQGLRYDPRVIDTTTTVGVKLLGAYERELHDAIEEIVASPMARVIDIGSAEGYYAAGIALRRPDVTVEAYDIDATARHMCRLTCRANRLTNVLIGTEATTNTFAGIDDRTVVFSDCEGAELTLLDPGRAPDLRAATVLVEVHDFVNPMISTTLRERFSPTHEIREIPTSEPDATIRSSQHSRQRSGRH